MMFFSFCLSRELSASGLCLNIFFFKRTDMSHKNTSKNRSIICLHQYLCVEYWNMTFLSNCPFMSTLVELIGLLLQL